MWPQVAKIATCGHKAGQDVGWTGDSAVFNVVHYGFEVRAATGDDGEFGLLCGNLALVLLESFTHNGGCLSDVLGFRRDLILFL